MEQFKTKKMKAILFTSGFFLFLISSFAQTSLSLSENGLLIGDSYTYREIQFPDPGSAGSKQVWDFSGTQYTGKSQVTNMQGASDQKLPGASGYNLSLTENGYDFFLNATSAALEECGYVNESLKLTLAYSDPVIKMKYPFSYGDQFSDHFIGIATYSETNKIDFFGDHSVTADGYGTLILPDLITDNVLRIKSVKKGLQINMCGMTEINVVKYSWFGPGYRYPLLSLTIAENQVVGGALQISRLAFTNTQQLQVKSGSLADTKVSVRQSDPDNLRIKSAIAVSLSPNPFTDKLTYSYSLNEPLPVSIELYTVTGKNSGWLVKNQLQIEGLHTGEFRSMMYNLAPGVYFLRFTFDKQIVIRKIVKI
jgi:hypothetical protein